MRVVLATVLSLFSSPVLVAVPTIALVLESDVADMDIRPKEVTPFSQDESHWWGDTYSVFRAIRLSVLPRSYAPGAATVVAALTPPADPGDPFLSRNVHRVTAGEKMLEMAVLELTYKLPSFATMPWPEMPMYLGRSASGVSADSDVLSPRLRAVWPASDQASLPTSCFMATRQPP